MKNNLGVPVCSQSWQNPDIGFLRKMFPALQGDDLP